MECTTFGLHRCLSVNDIKKNGLLSTLSCHLQSFQYSRTYVQDYDISLLQYMSPDTAIQTIILQQTPVMA